MVGSGDVGGESAIGSPPLNEGTVPIESGDMDFADREFFEGGGAFVDAPRGEGGAGGGSRVPAKEGGSAGPKAADGVPAGRDGGE